MITKCLFCKRSTVNSKSVEHIIPESIGSKKKVLPKGVVCDDCNQYFANKVENPVLSDVSLRNIRAYHQVQNKKGKFPSLLGEIAGTGIKVNLKLRDGKIDIQPENESDRERVIEHFHSKLNDGSFSPLLFPVEINPPKREMSRLLAKMALEALVYRNINDEAWVNMLIEHSHFDLIRNYARFGLGVRDWPYSERRIFPVETKMRHHETNEWVQAGFGFDILLTPKPETYFIFLLYGIEFVINLGGPSIKGYEEWLVQNGNISPVIEQIGVKLISKDNNGKTEYYLEGNFDTNVGLRF